MAKSLQQHFDEVYNQGLKTANSSRDQRVQSDNQLIGEMEAAVDKTTAAATKPYETQMEQLPAAYQKLFDANAVQELVGRRQVQEAMANMGLTDSGLNRTQQTALSVQRGNADAAARLEQQQKTQALQDQIAALIASGEAQKQQQAAAIRNNTANWWSDTLNNLYNNSMQIGTNQYNTEVQREIETQRWAEQLEAARQDREAQLEAARLNAQAAEAARAQAEAQARQRDYDNKLALAQQYINAGMDPAQVIRQVFGLTASPIGGKTATSSSGTRTSSSSASADASAVASPSRKSPNSSQFADSLRKELAAGRLNDYGAVNAIVQAFPGDQRAQTLVAHMAGVANTYQEYLNR